MANSGDQVIVHVNSHGANAKVNDLLTANNHFSNFTIKPIENINKIGLLYAAIPRVYEPITAENNRYHIRIAYTDANGVAQVDTFHPTIPLVNLYTQNETCIVDQELEVDGAGVKTTPEVGNGVDQVNIVEMLMFSMNSVLCVQGFGVVIYQHTDGRLQMAFGKRGGADKGRITSVGFAMNKSIARLFGMAQRPGM